MRLITTVATVTICFTAVVPEATAQPAPLEQADVPVVVDSGPLVNTAEKRAVIFSEVIQVPDASWIRLTFDQVVLGGAGSVLRITGLQDNVRQHHTARTLQQWRYTSACFNGNAVRIELLADPGEDSSRHRRKALCALGLLLRATWVGEAAGVLFCVVS